MAPLLSLLFPPVPPNAQAELSLPPPPLSTHSDKSNEEPVANFSSPDFTWLRELQMWHGICDVECWG